MRKNPLKAFCWILIVLCLNSCVSNSNRNNYLASTKNIITKEIPTPKPTLRATNLANPTITLAVDITPVPQTPIPIPSGEPNEIILDLLLKNNGCSYPCWWGIEPGQTNQDSAVQFFSQIPTLSDFSGDTDLLYENGRYLYYEVGLPTGYSEREKLNITLFLGNAGLIQVIQAFPKISLASVLNEFGRPTDIFLWARSYMSLSPEAEYSIVLFYEQGIAVLFNGKAEHGEMIKVCPDQQLNPDYVGVWLWNPSQIFTFQRISRLGINQNESRRFQQINVLGDISVDDFNDFYQNEETSKCFFIKDPDL